MVASFQSNFRNKGYQRLSCRHADQTVAKGKRLKSVLTIQLLLRTVITDRLTGNQANEHSEAILPRKFQSSYSIAVESLQHERLCSLKSLASEYSTLVARKEMSIFSNGPSRATLQSLHIGLPR